MYGLSYILSSHKYISWAFFWNIITDDLYSPDHRFPLHLMIIFPVSPSNGVYRRLEAHVKIRRRRPP